MMNQFQSTPISHLLPLLYLWFAYSRRHNTHQTPPLPASAATPHRLGGTNYQYHHPVKFRRERTRTRATLDDTEIGQLSSTTLLVEDDKPSKVLANFLSNPLASGGDSDAAGWPNLAFDLDPALVNAAKKAGFPIHYGDGSHPAVLQSVGISSPKAIMVMFTGKEKTAEAVQRLRFTYPAIPIYARAKDLEHFLDLKKAGATDAVLENAEISLQLGSKLLKGFGVMSDDLA
ncbi:K(+) efflux antiporter 3, chloroplastic [Arachis ipaensis]|uniref:K(+) efflux antiporter 3, chloroplastic n=1 Tax=Arachis ipaensis TaxID=130454 RepID=UPI000A2B5B7C|nr:K(+) efflux antiporter 3, chloroplastic [Arachis ipaensis]